MFVIYRPYWEKQCYYFLLFVCQTKDNMLLSIIILTSYKKYNLYSHASIVQIRFLHEKEEGAYVMFDGKWINKKRKTWISWIWKKKDLR